MNAYNIDLGISEMMETISDLSEYGKGDLHRVVCRALSMDPIFRSSFMTALLRVRQQRHDEEMASVLFGRMAS